MRAISVRQPWAWLIVQGYKDVENRTWATRYRGPIFIHAGKQLDWEGLAWVEKTWAVIGGKLRTRYGFYWPRQRIIDLPREFPLGGIVGIAEIVDCVRESRSPWFKGPWGIVLANAREVGFWACPGRRKIWEMGGMGDMGIMKGGEEDGEICDQPDGRRPAEI